VVQVEAVGAEPGPGSRADASVPWPANAWILDAKSRQVVWNLAAARTTVEASGLRRFTGGITLPAGTYELHYASYPATSMSVGGGDVMQNLKSIFNHGRRSTAVQYDGPYIKDGLYRQFGVTLRGAGRPAAFAELAAARKADVAIVATVHPVRHDAVERTAFAVSRAVTLDVMATGELTNGRSADVGWIIDADSRRELWRMSYARSQPAGGAPRNRSEHATLELPPGKYVAYFATDDGHDPAEWSSAPPFDPEGWGLVLRIANPAARAGFRTIDWKPVPATGTLATIVKVGDGESKSADFALTQPTNVQLYALGESTGGGMADYAWLMDLDHHVRIWSMKESGTSWAGGAEKNREADVVLRLPPGRYRLNYTSDDSHSFAGWNSAAPVEPEYWGVSAWVAQGKIDPASVIPVMSGSKLPALAAIHHVGDNLSVQAGFRLAADGDVWVHAIGEGSSGGMSDYASIEEVGTHRVVWTMRYSDTEPAGGDDKNRQFDGTVALKAGRYLLRWRSDGSHSWGRWNADPPDDQEGWGVLVAKVPAGGGS
jgi:hypothetical protein